MGYCKEHNDLTVTDDGTIRHDRKDWSCYRKSNTCVLAYVFLMALCIGSAIFTCSFVAIKSIIENENNQAEAEDAAQNAQVANVVPRFPVMQLHNGSYNGTHFHGVNNTLTAISTAIATQCPEETEVFISETSAEATTTLKKTLTQTRTIQESGTTVSSALAVPVTQSGASTTSQSANIITEVLTTSLTKTATQTVSSTVTESISETATQVQSSSVASSILVTKTSTATRKVTRTVEDAVVTVTYTPTTVVLSTTTVSHESLSKTEAAQCSPQDHTVYITVTKTPEPSSDIPSSSGVVSKTSTPLVSPSQTTGTVVVTYTVTVDTSKPTSKVPTVSSISSFKKETFVVTKVATRTVFETVVDGTTVTLSTATSDVLGQPGTPVWTSPAPTESSSGRDVIITKTVTDLVTETLVASSSETSISASSSVHKTTKSIFTTVLLTDRATKTVTVGGMATVTVFPKTSTSTSTTTTSAEVEVITEVDISTVTVTVDGQAQTSVVSVPKNTTATLTQTNLVTKTATSTITGESHVNNVTSIQEFATVNTTIYVTGTPMVHPQTTEQPLYPSHNMTTYMGATGTTHRPVSTTHQPPVATSTMPVPASSGEKHAEPLVFGAVDRNSMSCQTCLVLFILGLLVLF
ncbi:hypothetical protein CPLU01_07568 [Colletotrichum plurivorum]|uniref:Uncharacterized protein n=1 Tax=Colletotrichum plurivorum TaxID=2175906 RepID=A0A8H6KEM7_9PEZI|nr:hypothetical protein CPLU01_07568 [Colletotrichum plurivorum]